MREKTCKYNTAPFKRNGDKRNRSGIIHILSRSLDQSIAWCDATIAQEDFIQLVGQLSPSAACLVNAKDKVLAANDRLLDMASPFLSKNDLQQKSGQREIYLEELFLAEDLMRIQLVTMRSSKALSVRLRDLRPVLLQCTPVQMQGIQYKLLVFYEDTQKQKLDKELSENLKNERERLFEALRCTLRVYELHEKIRKIPALTRELLQVGEERYLYEEACKILRMEGMDFQEVTFLTVGADELLVAFSTREELLNAHFPLDGNSRYAEVFHRGGTSIDLWPSGVFVLPLRGREEFIGLMEVSISDDAKKIFTENHKVSVGIYDALLTIADIIAILVENNRLYKKTKQRSQTDALTGLYNRTQLIRETDKEIARADRFHTPLTVLFIDVDNMKSMNDELGHLQVDVILRELGAIFRRHLRMTDFPCRYGGDEFVILLPGTDLKSAKTKAEEICTWVAQHNFPGVAQGDNKLHVTISCGAAAYDHGMVAKELLSKADEALYRAKKEGKNQVAL